MLGEGGKGSKGSGKREESRSRKGKGDKGDKGKQKGKHYEAKGKDSQYHVGKQGKSAARDLDDALEEESRWY